MNNAINKRLSITLSIADLLKSKELIHLLKPKTPTMSKEILELPREYRKNETVETFETVLFVTQVATDVAKVPVRETFQVLYLIEKTWKLNLSKQIDMSIARLILSTSVMYN